MAGLRDTWLFCVCSFLVLCALGCDAGSPARVDARNVSYMENAVGSVVLQYLAISGRLPDTFDEALSTYKGTLPHRGDYYSRPYCYAKTSASSFSLLCFGENGRDEDGAGDDIEFVWENGKWRIVAK